MTLAGRRRPRGSAIPPQGSHQDVFMSGQVVAGVEGAESGAAPAGGSSWQQPGGAGSDGPVASAASMEQEVANVLLSFF